MVCFPTKKELTGEAIRKEICPSLRPTLIADLLQGYRADVFDSAPVPAELVSQLRAQERSFKANDSTFEPDVRYRPPLVRSANISIGKHTSSV